MQKTPIYQPKPPNKSKPFDLPFYAVPRTHKTSAEIINEARAAIRAVDTKRPFTPKDESRRLFGSSLRVARPSSSVNLGKLNYDSGDSRPISALRLEPLDYSPKSKISPNSSSPESPEKSADVSCAIRPNTGRLRLPSLGNERGSFLENLPEESVVEIQRRHSQPVLNKTDYHHDDGIGRAQSARCTTSNKHIHKKNEEKVSGEKNSLVKEVDSKTQAIEDLYFQKKVVPILDKLFPETNDEAFESQILEVVKQLYSSLEEGGLLGSCFKQRGSILKTLYKLLDSRDAHVQLQLARIILALQVKGNNLANLCKLIFKVTRNEGNDQLFLEDNFLVLFLQSIGCMNPSQDTEALVYGIGALKFLCMNSALLRELTNLQCVDVLKKLLSAINKQKTEYSKLPEQIGHVLFQLTGCLRNLAEGNTIRHSFISSGILLELCQTMNLFSEDVDIIMNISRILSKLTMHSDVCSALSTNEDCFSTTINLLHRYQERQELIVRLGFALGNLTAKNETARILLFSQSLCMETFIELLRTYLQINSEIVDNSEDVVDLENSEFKSPESPKFSDDIASTTDVIVKIIRIIANMSIHPDVGPLIATNNVCLDLILSIFTQRKETKSEELTLSTLATLNNLSFYFSKMEVMAERHLEIAQHLVKILVKDHMDAIVEVTRVFGNLSRSTEVRDFLAKMRVLQMMITLLDSGSREVVFTACGVLINFMADEDKRCVLKKEDGVRKLVDVLRDFGRSDWQLASMVCQTLWNYTTKMISTQNTIGEKETIELISLLEEFLDESTVLEVGCCQDGVYDLLREQSHDQWALEFCPVATNLLERITKCYCILEPVKETD